MPDVISPIAPERTVVDGYGAGNTKVLWTVAGQVAHPSMGMVTRPLPTRERPLVSIVDDDESVRESLPYLLRQFGFAAAPFASAEAFLSSDVVSETSCLLLDVGMPGMSGPDLQRELIRRRYDIPVVFITSRTNESARARLLADGATDCLFKPFSETDLLNALNAALRERKE